MPRKQSAPGTPIRGYAIHVPKTSVLSKVEITKTIDLERFVTATRTCCELSTTGLKSVAF